jgi:hypothetical protein
MEEGTARGRSLLGEDGARTTPVGIASGGAVSDVPLDGRSISRRVARGARLCVAGNENVAKRVSKPIGRG